MSQIEITSVQSRGVGGKECIAMRVLEDCQAAHYWVGLGIKQTDNAIYPLNDNLFWLGSGFLSKGDWVFLYTGWGEPKKVSLPNQSSSVYSIYWKRDEVVLGANEVFPYLLLADAVTLSNDMSPQTADPLGLFEPD